MNEIWQRRIEQSKIRISAKKQRAKYKNVLLKAGIVIFILYLFFPQYFRRAVYPYLYGKPLASELQISTEDYFEDVTASMFSYQHGDRQYLLQPRTKYSVTGRVGFVDDYTTIRNLIFRGQFQKNYINLVPRDIFLVIGTMAHPDVFKMFEFAHEERMGQILCKGVKYNKSFVPVWMNEEEYQKNQRIYTNCMKYMKNDELNNYHPIPANNRINKALSMLLPGDVVYLEGVLVDVPQLGLHTGTRKSQQHKDQVVSGYEAGMCFILYTTKIAVNGRVYE